MDLAQLGTQRLAFSKLAASVTGARRCLGAPYGYSVSFYVHPFDIDSWQPQAGDFPWDSLCSFVIDCSQVNSWVF
jgi:hypothetical protein